VSPFAEIQAICPGIAAPALAAVREQDSSPTDALTNLERFAGYLTRFLLAFEGLEEPANATPLVVLNKLSNRGLIPARLLPFFHVLFEADYADGMPDAALKMRSALFVKIANRLAIWFVKSYGPFLPSGTETNVDVNSAINAIRQGALTDAIRRSARRSASRRAATMALAEDETRVIIDSQLRSAGWQVDTLALRHSQGVRPERGVNKAISEWPTETGPADYALFAGLDFIGVVEAKKMGKDVIADLRQSKRYASGANLDGQARFIGDLWGAYRVPFLFSTNSRPYLEQLKEKSGIWFLDARSSTNHPRPLQGWYSADELVALLDQDIPGAHKTLAKESMEYLGLRDYQKEAARRVEGALEQGQENLLVAMATGTGKTRLAIGLTYRFIKAERFRRILFVVDRNSLGIQAGDKFKETRLEELKTFDQIYDMKGVDKTVIEATTKVRIATIQSLMRAIMYPTDLHDVPSVGQYDCIIVDEAHRGYTLDRELGEDELPYRNQNEYLSKFRRVIDYFDAVKIGLTATPAPHTVEIFEKPVFTYSYREAVIDGWLVDHEPPHQIGTRLGKGGIKWEKGDTVPVYDPATGQITNIEDIPDEIKLEIDHFNKLVITKPFNRTVARELVKYLDPDGLEKTLVFAATDDHADIVVEVLKDAFEESGVPVDDDVIAKITGSIDRQESMIRQFRNERLPNIAVTVDLLTTGIDVHEICNLVFMRRVRSRILFEQMLGRATRCCDAIQKDHFNIFDAVSLYEALEPVSGMKAVAANPTTTLGQLADELAGMIDDNAGPEALKSQMEQILAKLQRIMKRLDDDTLSEWNVLSEDQTPQQFLDSLKMDDPKGARDRLVGNLGLLTFLDENRHRPKRQLISHHDDELESHTRGYGDAKKPEDYLNAFREYVITNMNRVPALAIVCQRPRELTRKTLRELKLSLDKAGYTESRLRVAWRDWRNEDIAADIISFIRRQAMGDPLVSHEDRIRNAMTRIYALREWTAIQHRWLQRIEKQLLVQTILDREDFDKGAFASKGGFDRLNKIFQGNFQQVLDDINENLYPDQRETA